jgi:protein-S-isoprenylcysteine O-methyltransferase Ste14
MIVNWPALVAGLMIGAYWARVVKLVRKTKRTHGSSANFVPPELLGRILRIIWYPAVGIWILHLLLNSILKNPPVVMRPLYHAPIVQWIALAIALAAFIATLVCWKKMGKSWRMGINPDERTQLILSGPYEYVRHPIYALSSVLMLATLAIVPSPLMIATAACHLLLLQWEARREEKYLVGVHGEAYQSYMDRVGRFVPRLRTSTNL